MFFYTVAKQVVWAMLGRAKGRGSAGGGGQDSVRRIQRAFGLPTLISLVWFSEQANALGFGFREN